MLKQLDTLIGFVVVMSIVSLLVTIITQMISSLLGLRGKNLSDALQVMMHRINPNIAPDVAQQLAGHILTRPVISDSMLSMSSKIWDKVPILAWFRRRSKTASAIRPDELLDLVRDVAGGVAGIDPAKAQALQGTATALLTNLNLANPETSNAITAFKAQFGTLVGKDLTQAKALIQQATSATDVALVNLEKWFNSAQDRAQQWFAIHTRIVTVIAAFIAAFVLQLDGIDLLKRISADSDLRDKLVAASDTVQNLAKNVLTEQGNHVDKAVHKAAIAELKKKHTNLPSTLDEAQDFKSVEEARKWVEERLKSDSQQEAIADDYVQLLRTAKLKESLDTIKSVAGASPLQLVPSPYPISFNRNWPSPGWFGWLHVINIADTWSWPAHRLLGILVSAALLSLGAPFWFNTLKSLTNLRPKLAEEVDKDPKQLPQTPTAK